MTAASGRLGGHVALADLQAVPAAPFPLLVKHTHPILVLGFLSPSRKPPKAAHIILQCEKEFISIQNNTNERTGVASR